jgi:hypothetical protein
VRVAARLPGRAAVRRPLDRRSHRAKISGGNV